MHALRWRRKNELQPMLWNRKLLLNEDEVVWVELYQLRYFVRAAKYENISMAAQELHVTQPSISKAIRALEKELNTELIRMFRQENPLKL